MNFPNIRVTIPMSLKNVVSLRKFSSKKSVKEIFIPVPWGKIAGKWWGSSDIKPIMCFHGIQDNCGTFDRLIPRLIDSRKEISFLAFDFPGHGFSTPFPNGMCYDFFSYSIFFQRLYEYFNWEKLSFMGHSLGGMSSFCYTMLYPQRVDFLICIDSLKMINTPISAEKMRVALEKFMKYDKLKANGQEPISYTLDEMIQKITSAHRNSVRPEVAPILMKRNIAPSKIHLGKYYFTRDPTLKVRIMFNWPQDQIVKDSASITNPIFVCKATESSFYEPKENFYEVLKVLKKTSKDCDFHLIKGTHHLHLNEPEILVPFINNFLDKHYRVERIDDQPMFFETQSV